MADPRHSVDFGMKPGEIFGRILGGGFQRYLKDRESRTQQQGALNRIEQAGNMQLRNQQTLRKDERGYQDKKTSDDRARAAEEIRGMLDSVTSGGIIADPDDQQAAVNIISTLDDPDIARKIISGFVLDADKKRDTAAERKAMIEALTPHLGVAEATIQSYGAKTPSGGDAQKGYYTSEAGARSAAKDYFRGSVNSKDEQIIGAIAYTNNVPIPVAEKMYLEDGGKVRKANVSLVDEVKINQALDDRVVEWSLSGLMNLSDYGVESGGDEESIYNALTKNPVARKEAREFVSTVRERLEDLPDGVTEDSVVSMVRYESAMNMLNDRGVRSALQPEVRIAGGSDYDSPIVHPIDANTLVHKYGWGGDFLLNLPGPPSSRSILVPGTEETEEHAAGELVRYVSISEIVEVLSSSGVMRSSGLSVPDIVLDIREMLSAQAEVPVPGHLRYQESQRKEPYQQPDVPAWSRSL